VQLLLRKKEVAHLVGFHGEHVMRLVRQGKFPAPIKVDDRPGSACRWPESEIAAWVDARLAARLSEEEIRS